MNFIDKLISRFGSAFENNPDYTVHDRADGSEITTIPSTDQPSEQEYQYTEESTNVMHGVELSVVGTRSDGASSEPTKVFAGSAPRSVIESGNATPNTWFGYTTRNGLVESVGLTDEQLLYNTAIFGKTGYGKSSLVNSLLLQWAYSGHGFCFATSRETDVSKFIESVPEERLDDVVIVQPENGVNVLDVPLTEEDSSEFTEYVEDLVYTVLLHNELPGGPKMESALTKLLSECIRADETLTLKDVKLVLEDNDKRENVHEKVLSEELTEELSQLSETDLDPVIRRITELITDTTAQSFIADYSDPVDLYQSVAEEKIIIFDYSSLFAGNTSLVKRINAILLQQLWSAIRTRESEKPFFVALDGLQTDYRHTDLSEMLSKSRGHNAGFVISHQIPSQLSQDATEAIQTNCNNVFSTDVGIAEIGDNTGVSVADMFGDSISSDDLVGINKFQFESKIRTEDGTKRDLIESFAPYPPLRTQEEVEDIIDSQTE